LKITVKPYLYLKDCLGWHEIALELPMEATVADLFRTLRLNYGFPDQIKISTYRMPLFEGEEPVNLTVLVNGRHIKSMRGTKTILEDGTVVTLFPPSAGG
jgi:molybdopterin converting factor small subunit